MTCCNKGYCESIEQILKSESELTEYLAMTFYCDVFKWIEEIPEYDKRIKLFNDVMSVYTNRTCAVSNLICSSKDLLKCCSNEKRTYVKKLNNRVSILEKIKIIKKCECTEECYFLVYDSCTKATCTCNYNEEYDDECLKTSIYFLD